MLGYADMTTSANPTYALSRLGKGELPALRTEGGLFYG